MSAHTDDGRLGQPHEDLAWMWLLALAGVAFGVGWFADALIALL